MERQLPQVPRLTLFVRFSCLRSSGLLPLRVRLRRARFSASRTIGSSSSGRLFNFFFPATVVLESFAYQDRLGLASATSSGVLARFSGGFWSAVPLSRSAFRSSCAGSGSLSSPFFLTTFSGDFDSGRVTGFFSPLWRFSAAPASVGVSWAGARRACDLCPCFFWVSPSNSFLWSSLPYTLLPR